MKLVKKKKTILNQNKTTYEREGGKTEKYKQIDGLRITSEWKFEIAFETIW